MELQQISERYKREPRIDTAVRQHWLGGAGGFTFGTKRFCTKMTSCAEARCHFAQCGLSRLDGDHDGVPCERLCRESTQVSIPPTASAATTTPEPLGAETEGRMILCHERVAGPY